MTIDVGLRYPHKLAGLGASAAGSLRSRPLLKEISPVARQQRLLLTHGKFDPLIPFAEVRKQAQRLKTEGFNRNGVSFPGPHHLWRRRDHRDA